MPYLIGKKEWKKKTQQTVEIRKSSMWDET